MDENAFIKKIDNWKEKLFNLESSGEVVGAISFFATVLGVCLKLFFELIISGYNSYFEIPNIWNSIYLKDFISQIVLFLGLGFVFFLTNYGCYILLMKSNTKLKFWLSLLLIFVFTSIYPVIYIFSSFKFFSWLRLRLFFALDFLIFAVAFNFGFLSAITSRPNSFWKKINDKLSEKLANFMNGLRFYKRNFLLVFLIFLLFGAFFFLGRSFASSKRTFSIIEDNSCVILAENDSNYLCSPYISENTDVIKINKKVKIVLPKENKKLNYVTYKTVTFDFENNSNEIIVKENALTHEAQTEQNDTIEDSSVSSEIEN